MQGEGNVVGEASRVDTRSLPQGYLCSVGYTSDYQSNRCGVGLDCRVVAPSIVTLCLRPRGIATPGSACLHNEECSSNNCVGGQVYSWANDEQRRRASSSVFGVVGRCADVSGTVPRTGTARVGGGGSSGGRQTYRN